MTGIQARVAVVTCGCGTLPLERAMQPTAQAAWQVAADHVALTSRPHPVTGEPVPTCTPDLTWDHVPVALAATS